MAILGRTTAAALVVGLFTGLAAGTAILPAPAGQETASAEGVSGEVVDPTVASVSLTAAKVTAGPPATGAPWSTTLDGSGTSWNTGFYTSTVVRDDVAHVSYFADGSGSVMLASCELPCVDPFIRRIAPTPGIGTDLVARGDGLALSYLDLDSRTVMLATCLTAGCATPTVVPVASADTVGVTRLATTHDGRLVLAYPALGGGVVLRWCDDRDCRHGPSLELDGPDIGDRLELAAADGQSVWLVRPDSERNLVIARCTPDGCTDIATSTGAGAFPAAGVGPDGAFALSYHHATSKSLHLVTCTAAGRCREVAIDAELDAGYFSAVAVRSSGRPVIAHRAEAPATLMVADCLTPACDEVAHHAVSREGTPGEHLSLGLTADETPVLAHHDSTSRTLRLTHCADSGCAGTPGSEYGGASVAVALSDDGVPLVAHRHPATMDLRLGFCPAGECPEASAVDSSGDVGLDPVLVVGANGVSLLHRNTRTDALRTVTCDEHCTDPQLDEIPGPGPIAHSRARTSEGVTYIATTSPTGTVSLGRCHDSCETVDWTPVARDSSGAAALTDVAGTPVVAVATDHGVDLHTCSETCVPHTLTDVPATAVEIASTTDGLLVMTRQPGGRVEIHRCGALDCTGSTTETLQGSIDLVGLAGHDGRAVVAITTDAGRLQLLDCTSDCTTMLDLPIREHVWSLDVAVGGPVTTVATLGSQGTWTAVCDADACASDNLDSGATEAPVGSYMSHQ